MFGDVSAFGFDSIVTYDYKNSVMHSFRIGKSIDLSHILHLLAPEVDIGNTLGELVPAFHYFRFNEIKQFGFGHYEIASTDYSQLNYEFFLDLGTIRLAYCTLEASIYVPSRNHETNAFNAKIDGKISYSRTIFTEGVWGFCAAISFNNIPLLICHGNFSIGYSMNDDKVLMRLPIKDQGIFAISLKLF